MLILSANVEDSIVLVPSAKSQRLCYKTRHENMLMLTTKSYLNQKKPIYFEMRQL